MLFLSHREKFWDQKPAEYDINIFKYAYILAVRYKLSAFGGTCVVHWVTNDGSEKEYVCVWVLLRGVY